MPSLAAKVHFLLCCSLAFAATACGSGRQRLDGSLAEVVSTEYQAAELTLGTEQLALRFLTSGKAGDDTVLQLRVHVQGIALVRGVKIDLTEPIDRGETRGVVSRNVHGDERSEFPPLLRGHLRLDSVLVPEQPALGELSIAFVQGNVFGSGRTLFGSFEASVLPP